MTDPTLPAPVPGLPAPVPGPAAAARRPTGVSIAAAILFTMAAVGLVYAVVALAITPSVAADFRKAATAAGSSAAEVDDFVGLIWFGVGAGVLAAVLIGALLTALATGLRRGSRRARVATWVFGAFGLLCGCGAATTTLIQRSTPMELPGVGFGAAVQQAYPAGWFWINGILAGAQIIGYLVVMLLLIVASGDWFRRREAAPTGYPWNPQQPRHPRPAGPLQPPASYPGPYHSPPVNPAPPPDDRWAPPSS